MKRPAQLNREIAEVLNSSRGKSRRNHSTRQHNDEVTITITADHGTRSTVVDDMFAKDFDVTLTIAGVDIEGETTLIRDEGNERVLSSWGSIDTWMSGSLVAVHRALTPKDARALAVEIVFACRNSSTEELDVAWTDALRKLITKRLPSHLRDAANDALLEDRLEEWAAIIAEV